MFADGLNVLEFPQFVKRNLHVDRLEFVVNNLASESDEFLQELAEKAREAQTRTVCLAIDNDFSVAPENLEAEIHRASELVGLQSCTCG